MQPPAEEARVRPATAGDVSAVLVMMRQLYEEDGGRFDPVPAERAVRKLLHHASLGTIWVAYRRQGFELRPRQLMTQLIDLAGGSAG